MKLKMLYKHICKDFHDNDVLKYGKVDVCVLKWQPAENSGESSVFYIGDKNDHEFDNLNAPLKRLL